MKKVIFAAGMLWAISLQAQIKPELFSLSHDITSMPEWGPYSKQYAGISHIDDMTGGRIVDFSVIPGFYRRSYLVPNLLFESGVYPWRVNPSLTDITYRYELEWKDRVYVDATYHRTDDRRVLVEMQCVNNTEDAQNLLLHLSSSLHYAENYPQYDLSGTDEDCTILSAADYSVYEPAVRPHDYNLVYDGWLRGEKTDRESIFGTVIETSGSAGDLLEYILPETGPGNGQSVLLRYRTAGGECVKVAFGGLADGDRELSSRDYGWISLPAISGNKLTIKTLSPGVIRFDIVAVVRDELLKDIRIVPAPLKYKPEVEISEKSFIVKYDGVDSYYGVSWNYPMSEVRQFENSDLDIFMRRAVHRHPPKYFKGDSNGHYTTAFLRPVFVRPQSDTTIYALISCGTLNQVRQDIRQFHNSPAIPAYKDAKSNDYLPEAGKYLFGQQIFNATLLTNVVYPVYTQRQYIRHFTPGKNWNSLYTWDSGFISWAFNDIDPVKAFETIRAYTMEEGGQSAFIHHGTPLPIQFFAFSDLITKCYDREMMEFLYPRLKKYYEFIVGKDGTSTTVMPSGLIRTWDYFYSSGGWDDYPPQHQLRSDTYLYPSVAPMVSTSYYLRAAKILRMTARHLGLKSDERQYDRDIKKMASAILDNAWDEESGYFGYVTHDDCGNPSGLYRYPDGSNFNMGLDGVTPLVAGICPEDKRNRLTDNLFSPERMWTEYGISTVDRSAPYYSVDGYWNGSVWMPHQLILWKTLLDYDMPDEARKIAFTALDVYEAECERTYEGFEHFIVSSGRGAGWHNFSGLSSPVANWFASYFKKGTVTTGFDAIAVSGKMSDDFSSYEAVIEFEKDAVGRNVACLVCLSEKYEYEAFLNGRPVKISSQCPGQLSISLPASVKPAKLEVVPIN